MKTIGERIRQARNQRGWSAEKLAHLVGYKKQSGIANIENRNGGSGDKKLTDIARVLDVPVSWLLSGPDADEVPFLSKPVTPGLTTSAGQATSLISTVAQNVVAYDVNGAFDKHTRDAIEIMQRLTADQRMAAVANLRTFVGYLSPPEYGQALSVAGQK